MMKKKIAAALAAVMCFAGLGAFAGCGGRTDPNVVRIARWASTADEPRLEAWEQEFEADNPDIDIEWEFKEYSTHFSTLRQDLIGEAAADIIFINNWGLSRLNLDESDASMFVDLGSVDALQDSWDSLMPSVRRVMTLGDAVIGIPMGLVIRVPVINATVWESASAVLPGGKIPYDRTESFTGSEFTELLADVGTDTNILMGLNVSHNEALHMFLGSAGAPLIDENGKIGCNNEAGWAAAEQFRQFMQSGWVVPYSESGGGTYGDVTNAIINNKCLAGWANFGTLTNLTEYYAGTGTELATIAPFKAADATDLNDPDYAIQESKDVAYGDYNALFVPSFSQNKEKAYRVIAWMLEKEQQLTYAKWADIPVNQEAFDTVTNNTDGNWDPKLYSSYKIGMNNLVTAPVTSSEFSNYFTTHFADLCKGTITGKQFCERMAEGEKYL